MKKLDVTLLDSCFVSQLRPIHLHEQKNYPISVRLIGGIYDKLNQPHTDSLLTRAEGLIQTHDDTLSIDKSSAKVIHEKAIYGGILSDHYGHFLLETLSRTWYFNKNNADAVYFYRIGINENNNSYDDLKNWQKNILSYLITDTQRIKIINEPLVFDNLLVPRAGHIIRKSFAKLQLKALIALGEKITACNEPTLQKNKVWLSRSLLKKGAIAGEKKFEAALIEEGFTIVNPEVLPLAKQISVFENASVVAGFTGSAFHTILLAKNNGAKLLHFSREPRMSRNYNICAKATGFDAEFYNFFIRRSAMFKGTNANVLQDLAGIWNVLYTQGLVKQNAYYDADVEADLEHLDAALKKIISNKLNK